MSSDVLKALGARVRVMRKARGFTQEGFAVKAGIDRAFMGRVERGKQNIAVITAARIAAALDADLAELLRDLPRYDPTGDEASE